MIRRLEVDGFKSLQDFAMDLDPFTVLVGPNSAGKSNVLDALGLLSRLATRPIDEAFKQGRGRSLDQFMWRGGEAGQAIRFVVEMELPVPEDASEPRRALRRHRYELTVERRGQRPTGAERLVVSHESLRAVDDNHDLFTQRSESDLSRIIVVRSTPEDIKYHAYHKHTGLASLAQRLGDVVVPVPADVPTDGETPQPHVVRRRAVADRRISGPDPWREAIASVANELASLRVLQLDATRLREPSERIDSGALAPDASNLPTVLADLPSPVLGEVRADLVALVPGIASFHIVAEGDSFRIDFELSGGERLPARLVSDGTLRLLAILAALRAAPDLSLLAIEEPENGVYPGRLRALLSFLRETALPQEVDLLPPVPPQILITSHSPVVLGALRAMPEHLRFLDLVRRDGQLVSRARTVTPTPGPDRGRLTVSLREIDALLDAADSEAAEE